MREPAPSETGLGVRPMLERQARRLGERPFMVLPDGRLTYRDADELGNRTAAVLQEAGCRRGDIVMARCGNNMAMVAAWFGCMKLGAVFMPVNTLLTGEALRTVVAHAGAALLICDGDLYPEVAAIQDALPMLRTVLLSRSCDSKHVTGGVRQSGTVATFCLEDLIDRAPSHPPPPLHDEPGAAAKLMYTSGTTGTPKGVVWSRTCEAVWGRAYGEELIPIAEGESTYCCLPLFHITCQGTVLASLWGGGRITLDPKFDPFNFWARVREAEAVAFSFVGTILSVLGRRPERPDDADNPVRRILGAAAPADLWRDIERRFNLQIVETWGQTETASCWMRPDSLPQRPGTVGRPSSRFEGKLVAFPTHASNGADAAGSEATEVIPGAPGELWIRPLQPHVMFEGYLRDEEPAATTWTADGWYRTGDLLRRDEQGDFSFVGRLRDAVRRRGEMIATAEVERLALAHSALLEAAAVGVPAESGVEEELKLCVVPQPGMTIAPADLHRFLRERLPTFMVPRYIEVRDELPKTPTTRVQKYRLREAGTASCWDSRKRPQAIFESKPES